MLELEVKKEHKLFVVQIMLSESLNFCRNYYWRMADGATGVSVSSFAIISIKM